MAISLGILTQHFQTNPNRVFMKSSRRWPLAHCMVGPVLVANLSQVHAGKGAGVLPPPDKTWLLERNAKRNHRLVGELAGKPPCVPYIFHIKNM